MHPLYVDEDGGKHDDALLLILDRPVTRIKPVLMAPRGLRLQAGEKLWAAGWGRTEAGRDSVMLR